MATSISVLGNPYFEQENLPQVTLNQKIAAWGGHAAQVLSDTSGRALSAVRSAAGHVFTAASVITADSNALASVYRKFDCFIFKAIEVLKGTPGYFAAYAKSIHQGIGVIDTLQVATDVDYFYHKKYKEDSELGFASHVALAATNAGGAILWLNDLAFINLSRAANAIGQTRVFGAVSQLKEVRIFAYVPKVVAWVPGISQLPRVQAAAAAVGELRVFSPLFKLTFGTVVLRALTLTYALMAAESYVRLTQPGNSAQKTQAGIDLGYFTSELVIDAAVTFGVTSVLGLGALAAGCVALAATSVIHRFYKADELSQPVSAQ